MSQLPSENIIVLAGATGDLGNRIAVELIARGAKVKALVRPETDPQKVEKLRTQGAEIMETDYINQRQLTNALRGAGCVVSALSGLRDVIVDAQTMLLEATVQAGVPRFIPSDFSIDFTRLPYGTNRNLDLRKEFGERLDRVPIAATSILNGMFTDLLKGEAPVIIPQLKRVIYWENAEQLMDFTTISDTAIFTAAAALDPTTPRYLRIAGDVLNAYGLAEAARQATGEKYTLLRAGGLGRLDAIIKVTRTLFPQKKEVFPAWQGMQYMRNMFSGLPKLEPLDNNRYPEITFTKVHEVIAAQ
ncbi:NmrA family NAD(P)-binding protein [Pontibacter arcticus]|uniref:NmrA family protein n=1 Tax=Pontibacter arcticus TaxID=2080288 RepID=A0A364RBX3_9BACT|nr:NmrA family NAD(P)-binding protein [Pontibacter arcticus]RAU81840.1 NmrA family protein [Pontibacter arcticus]